MMWMKNKKRKTKLSWNNNSFKICDANIEYIINKYIGGCTMHVKYQVLDISWPLWSIYEHFTCFKKATKHVEQWNSK